MNPRSGRRLPVAVVIVNYRTPALAIEAALSVLPDLEQLGGVCVIVDNCSQDGSCEALSAFADGQGDRVTVIASPENGGFAAGNNIAFRAVDADAYLLLNSDAKATPGALRAMLAAGADSPISGLVTPVIVDESGRPECSRFRGHSILSEFVDGAHSGPLTRLFPQGEVMIYPSDTQSAPDWVSFAAVLVTRSAIDAAGLMDEDYFLYFEDCDYCLRIRARGFGIALASQALFTHKGGASTKFNENNAALRRLPAYYYRARSRFFRKWRGPLGPVAANLAWHCGRGIAHARAIFGRPAPRVSERRARDMWIDWSGSRAKKIGPPKGADT